METVKEFLDAGLVFVDGDIFDGVTGRSNSNPVDLMSALKPLCGVKGSGLWTLREFAWRTNMSEASKFDGYVEVKSKNGRIFVVMSCMVEGMSQPHWPNPVIEWRPVISKEDKMEDELAAIELAERAELAGDSENLIDLDDDLEARDALEKLQQEAKPTYTKEMHEAGELPPVGSEFMDDDGDVMKALFHHEGNVIACWGGDYISFRSAHCKPIDTRTDEEKLIDEAMELIDCEAGDKGDLAGVIIRMIKAGYRKP